MSLISNLRITTKIMGVLSLFVLLVLFVAGFGSLQLTRMAADTSGLINSQAESLKIAASANESLAHLHQLWLERVIETDADHLPGLRREIAAERKHLGEEMSRLHPFIDGPDVARYAAAEQGLAEYDRLMEPVESLLLAGDRRQAETRAQDQGGELYSKIGERFSAIVHQQDVDLDAGAAAATKTSGDVMWMLMAAAVIGLLTVGGLSIFVVRKQVTGPLVAITERMGRLAGGDTAIEIDGTERGDEVGAMARAVIVFRDGARTLAMAQVEQQRSEAEQKLVVETLETRLAGLARGDLSGDIEVAFAPSYASVKSNFNAALSSLRELIGSVMESTSTIRTGSGEIAQASEDLARRTEGNASSLEETTAAITQMDGRLKATAAAASRTVERADGAITTVSGGRAVADEAVQAMGRVSESAKGIDSVIEGLDKIAFQTRVLAMNAAVEAGRAGDAGRGFAVVADLVSALAMRAEEESKRARDQLTVTQTDIVAAVGAVEKVDAALVNISGDVGEVHKLLGEMAADNQAQSVAVTQISSAIGTMDQATQQNAAMVEETSAAARNLTSEVAALADQAARFNVGAKVTQVRRAPAPHRPSSSGRAAPSAVRAVPVAATARGAGATDDWASF
ncbi:MAG: methyl-accepting chemotaxis protein [Pseudomonadota bacterium]